MILDHVQFVKKGGTWSNRVAVNLQGEKKWITAHIHRPSGYWKINETKFQSNNWREKIIKTLRLNYSKAKFFDAYKDTIEDLIMFQTDDLVEYNVNAIEKICDLLGIDFKRKAVMSSSLDADAASTKMLIDIIKQVGCDEYLCGGGSDGYLEEGLFESDEIKLSYQDFVHPQYDQPWGKDFVKGLSIIDYIYNTGLKEPL